LFLYRAGIRETGVFETIIGPGKAESGKPKAAQADGGMQKMFHVKHWRTDSKCGMDWKIEVARTGLRGSDRTKTAEAPAKAGKLRRRRNRIGAQRER
jgi:hypothetical protein